MLGFLKKTDFHAYFDRGVLVAAILLLHPLARSLRIGGFSELGLAANPRWVQDVAEGMAFALASVILLAGAAACAGAWHSPPWLRLLRLLPAALLTAAVVGAIEEFLFRGAMQGAIQRTASPRAAWLAVAALFAVLHFLKPPSNTIAASEICWTSGFVLIPRACWQFAHLDAVIGSLCTLFVIGLVLGCARLKTRSLWLPIGLHAGWIIGHIGAKSGWVKPARRAPWTDLWFGADPLTGLAPLLLLLLTFAAVVLRLRSRNRMQMPTLSA